MADLEEFPEYIRETVEPHLDHAWKQVGRCVYCGPCNVRLYDGRIPQDHPQLVPPKRSSSPTTEAMRARWNMDTRPGGSWGR